MKLLFHPHILRELYKYEYSESFSDKEEVEEVKNDYLIDRVKKQDYGTQYTDQGPIDKVRDKEPITYRINEEDESLDNTHENEQPNLVQLPRP